MSDLTPPPGSRMRAEIHEQPAAVQATLETATPAIRDLAGRLRREGVEYVLIVARGTSDNAALYGLYMFGAVTMKLAATAAPSLLTCYDTQLDLRKTFVLGVSQSGKATDVIEVLHAGRERGAITGALTNTDDSPICSAVQHVLLTHAHEERAIAATKTYTTALVVMHQLAALWAGRSDIADQAQRVPAWIEEVLRLEPDILDHAERFRFMETCHWLARGLNFCTAKEAALKMAECCYVVPSSFSSADFMHGPIATTDFGFPCFIVNPTGRAYHSVGVVVGAVEAHGAEIIMLSNADEMLQRARIALRLPAMPEECSPMAAAVVGQLLALYIALEKGLDPDQPRGLRKVTQTL
ncbi:MAG: SIS domain-containing protein [Armatimonadetes bacterium]|nr:SIS domain-containing protein [Armatimonadota bacterium]